MLGHCPALLEYMECAVVRVHSLAAMHVARGYGRRINGGAHRELVHQEVEQPEGGPPRGGWLQTHHLRSIRPRSIPINAQPSDH